MINHEDIKEFIEKKKLQQVLLIAFSNSLELKLTTTSKEKNKIANIETKINLLKGLTTEISDKNLLSHENKVLQFHQKQVKNAYETWGKNRETLIKLLQIIAGNSEVITSFVKNSSEESLSIEENYIEDTSFDDNFTDFESDSIPENSFNYEENEEYEETEIIKDDEENWIDDIENDSEESVNNNVDESESFDDMSLDLDIILEEEEIFTDENKEEIEVEEEEIEEDWDNFIDDIAEEEVIINSTVEKDSPSLEVDEIDGIDDDWEEWLEDESSSNNKEHEPETIDWNLQDKEG
jgi:hypothetical protein